MDAHDRERITRRILFIVTGLLLLLLAALIGALIYVISADTRDGMFDIDMITPDGSDPVDISHILMPEFIGVTSEGKRAGVSFSDNVMNDLFTSAAPAISYVLNGENLTGSSVDWDSLTALDDSVFIRFHTELPETAAGIIADTRAGTAQKRETNSSYFYEMFLIPYSEQSGVMQIAVRSVNGDAALYSVSDPHVFITAGEIATMMKSYSAAMSSFVFAGDSFRSLDASEPVFTDRISARSIIVTNNTAQMIFNKPDSADTLIGIFGMNPDKVKLSQTDDESASSCIDSNGVLYIRDSSFEYRATADGGIRLNKIAPFLSGDRADIVDYISATAAIYGNIRDMDKIYAGGEASAYLTSVSSDRGTVTVELSYFFENIPLTDIGPAIRAVYKDGVLKEADVYTLSVRQRSDRSEMMAEWGFASHIEARNLPAFDLYPVYRTDFSSESVRPEWRAKTAEE